jgi:hypothetical protein
MFLSGVLFVLFLAGCWLAWVLARKARRTRYWPLTSGAHPALTDYDAVNVRWYPHMPGRTAPIGPDDDAEFLRQLAERIRRAE